MKKMAAVTIAVFMLTFVAYAQNETPKAEVTGGYSLFHADVPSGVDNTWHGWNAEATVYANRYFGITGNFGGNYHTQAGVSVHDYQFLFGPTLKYRASRVEPFAHVLFGGNHLSASGLGVSGSDTAFALAVGGGIDVPVSRHFGIRVGEFDYLLTKHDTAPFGGNSQNNFRFTAGIQIRF